jgi:hypothetical protein
VKTVNIERKDSTCELTVSGIGVLVECLTQPSYFDIISLLHGQ